MKRLVSIREVLLSIACTCLSAASAAGRARADVPERPETRETPTTALLASRTITVRDVPAAVPTLFPGIHGYTYDGCFAGLGGIEGMRAGGGYVEPAIFSAGPEHVTVPSCLEACARLGSDHGTVYDLVAVMGERCSCGKTLSRGARRVQDSLCATPCSGDAFVACGGQGYHAIYARISSGETHVVDLDGDETKEQEPQSSTLVVRQVSDEDGDAKRNGSSTGSSSGNDENKIPRAAAIIGGTVVAAMVAMGAVWYALHLFRRPKAEASAEARPVAVAVPRLRLRLNLDALRPRRRVSTAHSARVPSDAHVDADVDADSYGVSSAVSATRRPHGWGRVDNGSPVERRNVGSSKDARTPGRGILKAKAKTKTKTKTETETKAKTSADIPLVTRPVAHGSYGPYGRPPPRPRRSDSDILGLGLGLGLGLDTFSHTDTDRLVFRTSASAATPPEQGPPPRKPAPPPGPPTRPGMPPRPATSDSGSGSTVNTGILNPPNGDPSRDSSDSRADSILSYYLSHDAHTFPDAAGLPSPFATPSGPTALQPAPPDATARTAGRFSIDSALFRFNGLDRFSRFASMTDEDERDGLVPKPLRLPDKHAAAASSASLARGKSDASARSLTLEEMFDRFHFPPDEHLWGDGGLSGVRRGGEAENDGDGDAGSDTRKVSVWTTAGAHGGTERDP